MGIETPRLAAWLAAVLAGLTLLAAGLAWSAQSTLLAAALAGLLPAALTMMVAAVDLALRRRELEESRGAETAPDHALFSDRTVFLDARRYREQFERYLVPAVCLALAALEGYLARAMWLTAAAAEVRGERVLFVAASLGAAAFLGYVLGRLIEAVAVERGEPWLGPPADWLLFTVPAALLGAVAALAEGTPGAERWALRALSIGWAAAAVDQVIGVGLEVYRARTPERPQRPVHHSRLVYLVAHPGGLLDHLAATLDYQFGWQVSRTGLYRAIEGALAPLLAFQLIALWLLSCLVFVEPGERALRERLGRPSDEVLEPGPHLVWPWPIERVRRLPAGRLQTVEAGDLGEAETNAAEQRVVAWAVEHGHRHAPLLVGGGGAEPAGILSTSLFVRYRISDPRRFVYGFVDGRAVLSDLTWRELTRALAGMDRATAMRLASGEAASGLCAALQARCDQLGLGVTIERIEIGDAHAPEAAVPSYEEAAGAVDEAVAIELAAAAEAARVVPDAHGRAAERLAKASGEAYCRRVVGRAEAARFLDQLAAYSVAPEVYRRHHQVEAVRRTLAGRTKTVVAVQGGREVTTVDLQPRLGADLLDVPLADEGAKDVDHE